MSTETNAAAPVVTLLAPAKNESANLPELFGEITQAMEQQPRTWELIIVDDGSTDDSWNVILEHSLRDHRIRGTRLRRNFGKAAALAAGVEEARGEFLVTLDADLQDDPAEIPRLLAMLDDPDTPTDLVSGHKAQRKDPLGKRLPSKFFNWMTGVITGLRLSDHNCGLKAARIEVYRRVPLYGELHRYIPALAYQLGYRVDELDVHHRQRVHGKSNYGLERYVRGALDLLTVVTLTRYGRRPAHFFGGLGLVFGGIGTMILLYLTGVWVFTAHSIGTRPLLTLGILLEIFSLQMISVGLLAELVLHRTGKPDDVTVLIAQRSDDRESEPVDMPTMPTG